MPWSTEEEDREIALKLTFGTQPLCKLRTACNALEVTGRTYLPFSTE